MGLKAFRVQNFMGFRDSGWIELRPLTLLFGQNSAGKSTLLKALRMLQQSLDPPSDEGPLILSSGAGVDLGTYRDVVHDHDESQSIGFGFRCEIRRDLLSYFKAPRERTSARVRVTGDRSLSDSERFKRLLEIAPEAVKPEEAWASLEVTYSPIGQSGRRLRLRQVDLEAAWSKTEGMDNNGIFTAEWLGTEYGWWFKSDFLDDHQASHLDNPWFEVKDFLTVGDPFPQLPGKFSSDVDPQKDHDAIGLLLREFREGLREGFRFMNYLGPLRGGPKRFYYLPELARSILSGSGAEVLHRFLSLEGGNQWQECLDQVNDALYSFGFRLDVRHPQDQGIRRAHDLLFELTLSEIDHQDITANLCDVGFGWSQMLPVVLACVLAEPGSTIMIEQPELHLHPRGQALLADLFIEAINRGVHLLIETHSEPLLLRLRYGIAHTTLERNRDMQIMPSQNRRDEQDDAPAFQAQPPKGPLDSSQLATYFVDRIQGASIAELIEIDNEGRFTWQPKGFRGFFSDDFAQTVGITESVAKLRQLASGTDSRQAGRTIGLSASTQR